MAKYMKDYDFMVSYPEMANETPVYTARIKLDPNKALDVKKIIHQAPKHYPKLSGLEKIMSIKYFPGGHLKSEIKEFREERFKTLGKILEALKMDDEDIKELKPEEITIYLKR